MFYAAGLKQHISFGSLLNLPVLRAQVLFNQSSIRDSHTLFCIGHFDTDADASRRVVLLRIE